MSTPNRFAINRANAQHSTGPKTPDGKKQSSLNALRHGLTGQIVVMPTEDLAAYQLHLKSFTDEYHPKGATESHLVQALADTSWRLNRVAALETNLLTMGIANAQSPITDAPQKVQDAFSIVSALESQSKALSNLSLHSQRLARQFERTLIQLRDLQKIRRAQEKSDLSDLLDVIEMHESTGETYDPSADGFVFSEQQITEGRRARNRENLIMEAYEYNSESAAE
jgi:DNA-binding TFAR19-related protein (PDSD5 family)